MSNRTQVLERFATVTGLNPMTVEVILRHLGKAGLVPKGLPGRRSAHFEVTDLKNLILALAAYVPSEAVEAVRKLDGLPNTTNALLNLIEIPGHEISPGMTFGNWIEQEIEARSSRTEAPPVASEKDLLIRLRFRRSITMNLARPLVMVTVPYYRGDAPETHTTFFLEAANTFTDMPPVLVRQTTFYDELLDAAGDLLADTRATQTATLIPDPVPGRTGEGDATPETMKAAGPGSHDGLLDTPATQTRRRALLNKAQPIASQGRKQSRADGAVSGLRGFSTRSSKDTHNGTFWPDAASP